MQANTVPNQTKVNEILKKMSAELDIPLVATCDSHYLTRDDYKTQEILMCIQTGKKITDEDRMRLEQNAFYFKNYDEMTMIFDDEIGYEALENTNKIAARCNVEIEFGKYKLPRYAEKYIERAVEYHNKLVSEYNNDPNKALNDRMNNLYKEYCKNEKRNGSVNGRISKYAFEDVREFAAEAFALNRIRGGNSNNYYVKEVMSILKQYPKIKRNR